ncbi:hypothetical protein F4814DRAFT_460555 [Daldinia grandis]|nr:hypothetical protein F4814DRAFT_460555 [Daldinia grandis]
MLISYYFATRRRSAFDTEFHGFMSVSRDLCDMIYKYLLDKGSVFLPNYTETKRDTYDFETSGLYGNYLRYRGLPNNWSIKDGSVTRSIGLIGGVSKIVHEEAMSIYCGCNRFVSPYGPCDLTIISYHPYQEGPWDVEKSLPIFYPFLRCVSSTFDMRSIQVANYAKTSRNILDRMTVFSWVGGADARPSRTELRGVLLSVGVL